MLQAGVATKDMDPRWMSSISWYFLCIFGLQFVFNFLLGSDNGMTADPPRPPCPRSHRRGALLTELAAASQMAQQLGQMGPQSPQMFGPGVDPDKQFLAEAENLAVIEHYSVLDGIEERLLRGVRL